MAAGREINRRVRENWVPGRICGGRKLGGKVIAGGGKRSSEREEKGCLCSFSRGTRVGELK